LISSLTLYEPSEDSFLLGKYVGEFAADDMLDMGAGTGYLSLIAREKTSSVLAVDINKEAVKECLRKGLNSVQSDLFENVKGKFDLIIFNPPYLPKDDHEDKDSSIMTTGGRRGHEIIERFLKQAKFHLNAKGQILLIISTLTGRDKVEDLMKLNSFDFTVITEKALFFEKLIVYRLVLIR